MKRAITGRPETNNDLAQGEVLNFQETNKENTMDRTQPRLNWNPRGLLTGLMMGLLLLASAPPPL